MHTFAVVLKDLSSISVGSLQSAQTEPAVFMNATQLTHLTGVRTDAHTRFARPSHSHRQRPWLPRSPRMAGRTGGRSLRDRRPTVDLPRPFPFAAGATGPGTRS